MSVRDVAEYILRSQGEMTAMKLQKLVYYSQAWSLVWDERPMFNEQIQAWANGPVCRALYSAHHRQFSVVPGAIMPMTSQPQLDERARATVDAVLKFYGEKSAQWLSDLTHLEMPWLRARERAQVPDGAACEEEITIADMHEYYSGLQANNRVN
ncbi:Panacea domain-containing protein [Rhizobium leguminosarum]|uniref:Panacea domain-containing protein n=1 Tax=Rhizobium leguminosarum TaxID=384 RepID=UPI003F9CEE83